MSSHDFLDDGQSEAAALGVVAAEAVESLEHELALRGRDTRTGVLDPQHAIAGIHRDADRHASACRGRAEGVVDEIHDEIAQHRRIRFEHDVRRGPRDVEGEVELPVDRDAAELLQDRARQFSQVDSVATRSMAVWLDARQAQELIRQPRHVARRREHRPGRVSAFFLRSTAQRERRLRAQKGQRRAELVRRVRGESPLRFELEPQAFHVAVQGCDQRAQLRLHVLRGERAELVGLPFRDRLTEAHEWSEAAPQREPCQERRHNHQARLLQHVRGPQGLRHRTPPVEGLRDDDRGGHRLAAGRDVLPNRDQPNRLVTES